MTVRVLVVDYEPDVVVLFRQQFCPEVSHASQLLSDSASIRSQDGVGFNLAS
jgi:hypothetical protein